MRQLLAQRTSWNALCGHCTLSIPTEKGKMLPMSKISGHIHCETFESSFFKLFNYLYLERFWDSFKSIFYFIPSTNASLVSSYNPSLSCIKTYDKSPFKRENTIVTPISEASNAALIWGQGLFESWTRQRIVLTTVLLFSVLKLSILIISWPQRLFGAGTY